MKDKIIEILKEAYPRQDIIMEWAMSDTVDLHDALEKWRVNIATRIDSLSLPTLSEGEIEKMAEKNSYFWMSDSKRIVAKQAYKEGFKAAIKELTKPKEE